MWHWLPTSANFLRGRTILRAFCALTVQVVLTFCLAVKQEAWQRAEPICPEPPAMTTVDFAAFVDKLADVAAETILPFFRTALQPQDKNAGSLFDPVTEADRAAESAMRHLIRATFPDHGIIGEEFGSVQSEAEFVWVIDPIDGTKSFISGLPVWGSLIGLLHNQRPAYGMMVQPFTQERFYGDGRGAIWRGPVSGRQMTERKLATRCCPSLAEATLMTTSPLLYSCGKLDLFRRVESKVRLSRYGGDCYAFAMLAAGHVDCVIESNLKPYDIVALVPIIEGAGGIVTSWDGGSPAKGGDVVASCTASLHNQTLRLLGS
jgi:histidinol phosphatase-like enzyme (inositol monophosphatase family)